jgi:RNA polymerase sigma factor (sigma-70 family)
MTPISSPEELFMQCRRGLYVMALRVLRNEEDAEDCLQETALRMVRCWKTCNLETAIPWALTIVHNQAISVLRKRRTQPSNANSEAPGPSIRSHENAIIARLTLAKALKRLNRTEREAMVLWFAHRRSVKAIGAGMHTRQYRALHRMRKLCA